MPCGPATRYEIRPRERLSTGYSLDTFHPQYDSDTAGHTASLSFDLRGEMSRRMGFAA